MSDEQVIAGRYRLVERLGGGGMGVVWQAYDERLHRKVAVKQVLLPSELTEPQTEEIVRRTMREGRIAARLQHPQLITVFDVVQDGGQPYLILEYFPSQSLSAMGTLPPLEAARIGSEAAAALTAAHAAGVVHRDIKPANVLVGEDGTVKITDFGISRVVEDLTGTTTGTFAGTPAYLSPEVAKGGRTTFASDVYSLGAMLYTVVEGEPPAGHDTNPMALLYKVASGTVREPTRAGPLSDVLKWLLSAEPEERPTMAEARDALAAVAAGGAAALPAAAAPEEPRAEVPVAVAAEGPAPAGPVPSSDPARTSKRRMALLGAGLLAVAVVAAVVTVLVNRQDTQNADRGSPPAGSSSESRTTTTTTEPTTEPTTRPTTSEARPTTTTTTTTKPPAKPPAQQRPTTPQAAITSYYGLMPGNLDAAWQRLTPRYQASPAGGRGGYERFWGAISAVSVSGVAPTGTGTVEATVLYTFKDGRRTRERHRYILVNQGGTWLIDRSSVLSSGPA
jgi:serine/threonine protein kinase